MLRARDCVIQSSITADQIQLLSEQTHFSSPVPVNFRLELAELIRNRVRIAASFSPWSTSLTAGTLRKASVLSSRNSTCRWLIRSTRRETKDGQRSMTGDRILIRSCHAKIRKRAVECSDSPATANTHTHSRARTHIHTYIHSLSLRQITPRQMIMFPSYCTPGAAWLIGSRINHSPISGLTFPRTSPLSQSRREGRGLSILKGKKKKKNSARSTTL